MGHRPFAFAAILAVTCPVAWAQAPDPVFRDGFQCPYPQFAEIGGPCNGDAQCDSAPGAGDGFCLGGTEGTVIWPAAGYCTRFCSDGSNCGPRAVCQDIGGGVGACLPVCCDDGSCAPGFMCADRLVDVPLATDACVPGNPDAVDGSPCGDIGDCDLAQCIVDVEHPGGQCSRLGCTVGNDATCSPGGDGHCAILPAASAATCIDACTADADCRQAEGYRCVDGGPIGRYCRAPHVGDACAAEADCGDAAVWDCRTGVTFPGGYCTMPCTTSCVAGSSVCADDPFGTVNYCADSCSNAALNTQAHCRPGYFCRDVDPTFSTVAACVSP